MGNLFSDHFFDDLILNYKSVESPTPYFTIRFNQTKWVSIFKGIATKRKNDQLIIYDNNEFYTITILSTKEPIDQAVYYEIYKEFKSLPIYSWGNVPKTISNKILMGVWGFCDIMTEKEQEF